MASTTYDPTTNRNAGNPADRAARRRALLRYYGGACIFCGLKLQGEDHTADDYVVATHVIPWPICRSYRTSMRGGKPGVIVAGCADCNRRTGDTIASFAEFAEAMGVDVERLHAYLAMPKAFMEAHPWQKWEG